MSNEFVEQDQEIDVEVEKANLREIERNLPIVISLDVETADIILKALTFQMRVIGRISHQFRLCQEVSLLLESKIREAVIAKINK